MSDEAYSFSTARVRLEEIVSQVRKKDTSLEKSLDLLEEGVRLANACTELIDHADWNAGNAPQSVVETGAASEESTDAKSAPDVVSNALDDTKSAESDLDESPETADAMQADAAGDESAVVAGEETADGAVDPADDFGDADEAWTDEEPAGA